MLIMMIALGVIYQLNLMQSKPLKPMFMFHEIFIFQQLSSFIRIPSPHPEKKFGKCKELRN